jgi:hypothetical protein
LHSLHLAGLSRRTVSGPRLPVSRRITGRHARHSFMNYSRQLARDFELARAVGVLARVALRVCTGREPPDRRAVPPAARAVDPAAGRRRRFVDRTNWMGRAWIGRVRTTSPGIRRSPGMTFGS